MSVTINLPLDANIQISECLDLTLDFLIANFPIIMSLYSDKLEVHLTDKFPLN